MVVCPRCGCPQEEDFLIESVRQVRCGHCSWEGSSEDLILVQDGKFADPRAFVKLYTFLHKEVSPVIGRTLIQLGLATADKSPSNVRFLTGLLIAFTRAGFEALLKGVLDPDGRRPD